MSVSVQQNWIYQFQSGYPGEVLCVSGMKFGLMEQIGGFIDGITYPHFSLLTKTDRLVNDGLINRQ